MPKVLILLIENRGKVVLATLVVIAVVSGELSSHVEERVKKYRQPDVAEKGEGTSMALSLPGEDSILGEQKNISPHPRLENPAWSNQQVVEKMQQTKEEQKKSSQRSTKRLADHAEVTHQSLEQRTVVDTPKGRDWTPQLGEHLVAKCGSSWYPAKIIGVESVGKYKIHYTKYADTNSTFDEVVALDRLRPSDTEVTPTNEKLGQSKENDNRSWTPQAGELVEAKWGGSWYPAKIIGIDGDGNFRIHYTKYADTDTTFDESVPLKRLKSLGTN